MKPIYVLFILVIVSSFTSAQSNSSDSLLWLKNDSNVYYMNGNVGIGTENPNDKLEVIGDNTDSDGNVSGGITIKNNNYSRYTTEAYSNTFFRNSQIMGVRGRGTFDNPEDVLPGDRVFGSYAHIIENKQLKAVPIGSIEYYVGTEVSSGEIRFATLSPGEKMRYDRMIVNQFGNVGIGTMNPNTQLHVVDLTDNSLLRVESSVKQAGIQLISNQDYKPFLNFGTNGIPGSLGTIYYDINYNHIAFRAQTAFDETKEMVINDKGFVGIGTKNPKAKLEVANGDIYIEDITKGIIMKSPNGQCWRGQVDNDGELHFTLVDCPNLASSLDTEYNYSSTIISIYPNPTDDILNVNIQNRNNSSFSYKIYNIIGETLTQGEINTDLYEIDTASLVSAIYIIAFFDENGIPLSSQRFVRK